MSGHVFVVSEWQPKENKDPELWEWAQNVLSTTREKEKGCIRAHVTRQIKHPGSPGTSKYTIILLQEYVNVEAFDLHCASEYVTHFFETCVKNPETAIVEDWTCRLFSEDLPTTAHIPMDH